MKKQPLLILLALLLKVVALAQPAGWLWAKSGGGYYSDAIFSVAADAAGNWYAAGTISFGTSVIGNDTLASAGGEDALLIKFDALGNVLWTRSAGGGDNDFITGIATDAAGNCYATGGFQSNVMHFSAIDSVTNVSTVSNAYDLFIAKYDANGNVLWTRSAGGPGYDWAESITVDAGDNCYITGSYNSASILLDTMTLFNAGSYDFFLAKYDPAGNLTWARSEGGVNLDRSRSIACRGNALYIGGEFYTDSLTIGTSVLVNAGYGDVLVAKFDTAGNPAWAKNAGGLQYDAANDIAVDANGNCYVTGYYNSGTITFGATTFTNGVPAYDLFLAKYDAAGNVSWATNAGANADDIANAVATDNAGHIFITGRFKSTNIVFGSYALYNASVTATVDDMFLVKYDSSGTVHWAKHAGSTADDWGYAVATNSAGNCLLAGDFASATLPLDSLVLTNSSGNAYRDFYVALLDNSVGIGDPFSIAALPVHPNPSTGIVAILLPPSQGELSVFDLSGRLVYQQQGQAGSTTLDLHFLPDGVYLVRFTSEELQGTQKLVIRR